jgi:hypothetical protein
MAMTSDKVAMENVNSPGRVVRVDADKYEAMKRAFLKVLPATSPGMTAAEIKAGLLPHLPEELFPQGAKAGWWMKGVQLDLEAKGGRRCARRNQAAPLSQAGCSLNRSSSLAKPCGDSVALWRTLEVAVRSPLALLSEQMSRCPQEGRIGRLSFGHTREVADRPRLIGSQPLPVLAFAREPLSKRFFGRKFLDKTTRQREFQEQGVGLLIPTKPPRHSDMIAPRIPT